MLRSQGPSSQVPSHLQAQRKAPSASQWITVLEKRVATHQQYLIKRRAARSIPSNATISVPGLDAVVPFEVSASYGPVCDDTSLTCPDGYFCVNDVLCLEGAPNNYQWWQLLTVGAISKVIQEEFGVSFDCIGSIGQTFDDLFTSLTDWDQGNKDDALTSLTSAMSDFQSAVGVCEQAVEKSFWQKLWDTVDSVVKKFFPELSAAYHIIVDGVDLMDDFDDMLTTCDQSSGSTDYIACGSDLGDMVDKLLINQYYKANRTKSAPNKFVGCVYDSHNGQVLAGDKSACASQAGSFGGTNEEIVHSDQTKLHTYAVTQAPPLLYSNRQAVWMNVTQALTGKSAEFEAHMRAAGAWDEHKNLQLQGWFSDLCGAVEDFGEELWGGVKAYCGTVGWSECWSEACGLVEIC